MASESKTGFEDAADTADMRFANVPRSSLGMREEVKEALRLIQFRTFTLPTLVTLKRILRVVQLRYSIAILEHVHL